MHDPVRGSTPAYSGRICRTRSLRIVMEYSHPIRSAITVAGIFASSRSHFRISGSTASTSDPRGARRHAGGSSDTNAARTVFLATPSLRTIALIGMPSALCNRRISAQSSTEITLQECRRGQHSNVTSGSVFTRRRHHCYSDAIQRLRPYGSGQTQVPQAHRLHAPRSSTALGTNAKCMPTTRGKCHLRVEPTTTVGSRGLSGSLCVRGSA